MICATASTAETIGDTARAGGIQGRIAAVVTFFFPEAGFPLCLALHCLSDVTVLAHSLDGGGCCCLAGAGHHLNSMRCGREQENLLDVLPRLAHQIADFLVTERERFQTSLAFGSSSRSNLRLSWLVRIRAWRSRSLPSKGSMRIHSIFRPSASNS